MIISFFDKTLTLYHKKRLIQTDRIKIMKERIISEANKKYGYADNIVIFPCRIYNFID